MKTATKETSRQKAEARYRRPDGNKHLTLEQEHRLNEAFAIVFKDADKSGAQSMVLDYLASISINHVVSPNNSDAALRDREGMRRMYSILKTRIDFGRNKLPEISKLEAN